MERNDLLTDDGKLFAYRWTAVAFVFFPPLIIWWKEPHNFLHAYRDLMLFAFSWPLLVLGILYFFRRRFLLQLIERGTEVSGIVTGFQSSGYARPRRRDDWKRADVSVRIGGEERVVHIDVPLNVEQNQRVTLLVDPLNPRRAALLKS